MGGAGSTDAGWTLSRGALRELDRLAVEEFVIPSIVLMENAARGLAAHALEILTTRGRSRAVIFAGPGANGGDGFALARHLHNAGAEVSVLTTRAGGGTDDDAGVNLEICRRMDLKIRTLPRDAGAGELASRAIRDAGGASCLVVDALLGTGLDRPVEGSIAGVIRAINGLGAPRPMVLSVDVPSGLDADSGEPLGEAIRADLTVSLAARKRGFGAPGCAMYTGRVVVEGIGAPRELIERLADDGS